MPAVGFENLSVQPRRTKSLPSKYMIPSEEIGEYESEPSRRKSAPAKPPTGGLYPLSEEGTYGAIPISNSKMPPSSGVPFQRIRERKPKVYSSYSVDSGCQMHAKKLASAEKKAEEGIRKHSQGSRAGSVTRSIPSPAPSRRTSSVEAPPPPPSTSNYPMASSSSGRSSRSPDFNEFPPYRKVSNGVGPQAGNLHRKPSFDRGVPKRRSSSSHRCSNFEENEEYEYAENRMSSSGFRKSSLTRASAAASSYMASSSTNTTTTSTSYSSRVEDRRTASSSVTSARPPTGPRGGISLVSLREPKIDTWDSMGILGLSAKMWSDTTKKRQESFVDTAGRFLRPQESASSYIM